MVKRRDQIAEDFTVTKQKHKKAKIASAESMIGKWEDVAVNDDETKDDYQYYVPS